MTINGYDDRSHVDDGDIVRLLDGECGPEEARRLRAHLDVCEDCRGNADSLESAAEQFSRMLAQVETTSPAGGSVIKASQSMSRRWSTPKLLRIAAVFAAVVLAFSVTPARAWIALGWEKLTSLVASEPPTAAVDLPETSEDVLDASSVVGFSPRGDEFRLEFVNRPNQGTLVLIIDSMTTATASVFGGDGADDLIVLPDGLRIGNMTTSTGDYEVRLPLTLSAVVVYVAGEIALTLDLSEISSPIRRELGLSDGAGD